MKRIHIVGRDLEKVEGMKEDLEALGFSYVEENPDLVITYGGDGMFLIGERLFPGIPKICMRDSEVGNKCCDFDLKGVLKKYLGGDYSVEEIRKLKAVCRGRFETRELIGVNDIVIRNSLPTEAVRFNVRVGEEEINGMIGDGVVVSTAYGSDGYFSSITGKGFRWGIGLAFNNVTESKDSLFFSGGEKIEIEIVRGPAVLVADNNRDYINLENGDRVMIKQIGEVARRIVFGNT